MTGKIMAKGVLSASGDANGLWLFSHTEKNDIIPLISMRKATKNEEDSHFQEIGDKLETDQEDEG